MAPREDTKGEWAAPREAPPFIDSPTRPEGRGAEADQTFGHAKGDWPQCTKGKVWAIRAEA